MGLPVGLIAYLDTSALICKPGSRSERPKRAVASMRLCRISWPVTLRKKTASSKPSNGARPVWSRVNF